MLCSQLSTFRPSQTHRPLNRKCLLLSQAHPRVACQVGIVLKSSVRVVSPACRGFEFLYSRGIQSILSHLSADTCHSSNSCPNTPSSRSMATNCCRQNTVIVCSLNVWWLLINIGQILVNFVYHLLDYYK